MGKFKSIFSKASKTQRKARATKNVSIKQDAAPGILNKHAYDRMAQAVKELSILNELAQEIGALADSRSIMKKIIERSLKAVHGEQAVITLLSEEANDPMKTYDRLIVSSVEREQYHFEQNLLGWMLINKKPLVIHDPRTDERFKGIKWEKSIESLLCVPLMIKSDLKGVLTVYNKRGGEKFSSEDERLLSIMAAQSAQVLENARLYEKEKTLLQMQEELKLAARIQADLLPHEAPLIEGYDVAGRSIPARLVGGDYYDFISMVDDRLVICLGDVSGKGLPASLLMANLQATLRGQTLVSSSPAECLYRSNKLLYHSTDLDKFATLFCALLDMRNHSLTYSSAGHEPPMLLSNGSDAVRRLEKGGLILGISDDFVFEEDTMHLEPGDALVIYSDGVLDAADSNGEPFGEERLIESLQKNKSKRASDLIDAVLADIASHSKDLEQIDDITMIVLKRKTG